MMGKGFSGAALVVVAVLALGGCGADSHGTSTPTVSLPPTRSAPWAEPVSTGEELWQTSSEGLTLTAYNMGEDTATFDSEYSDDVTNEPLVAAGDPVVFVNVVVTNTSDQTQFLANDVPDLFAAPRESPYQEQGLAEVADVSDLQWQSHHVWYHSVRTGADSQMGSDPSPWRLAPGESCAMGYALPLSLGHEWGFIGTVWVYENDDPIRAITFDQQNYTFG